MTIFWNDHRKTRWAGAVLAGQAQVMIALLFFGVCEAHGAPVVQAEHNTTATLQQLAFAEKVVAGAKLQLARKVQHKETYEKIAYPLGDVNPKIGVCTDLVIRSFRKAGIDLQQLVHEDRAAHPELYPTHLWKYKKPDKNIDHRRCQNLVVFFPRFAMTIDKNDMGKWQPGDVVFFARQGRKYPWHVGIVSQSKGGARSSLTKSSLAKSSLTKSPLMIHSYPPRVKQDAVSNYGLIHSVFRWNKGATITR